MTSSLVQSLIALVAIAAFLLFPSVLNSAPAAFQSPAGISEQEERYNQALEAYSQNRLSDARTLFEGVRGNHNDEAQKYAAMPCRWRTA